jgi:lipopolysaccharide transport system ATP-binding protein
VLLIDEVLAVGDLAFQEKCQARMKRFRDEGTAIVFVSHHLAAVAQLCNQALLLDHGEAARFGPPADVIREYCNRATAGPAAGDESDVAIGTRLSCEGSDVDDVDREVAPGERMQLDVTLEFRCDVERATIGVVVWDLRRELYVYGASSDVVGVAPIRARTGDVRTFSFSFEANLTRGLYAIEVNVVDPERHAFIGVARGIAHFQVAEAISYDGVANLYLKGREGAAVQRLRDGRSAAAL